VPSSEQRAANSEDYVGASRWLALFRLVVSSSAVNEKRCVGNIQRTFFNCYLSSLLATRYSLLAVRCSLLTSLALP
jgi:hypothetical protein